MSRFYSLIHTYIQQQPYLYTIYQLINNHKYKPVKPVRTLHCPLPLSLIAPVSITGFPLSKHLYNFPSWIFKDSHCPQYVFIATLYEATSCQGGLSLDSSIHCKIIRISASCFCASTILVTTFGWSVVPEETVSTICSIQLLGVPSFSECSFAVASNISLLSQYLQPASSQGLLDRVSALPCSLPRR